jgi:hypothetical protein
MIKIQEVEIDGVSYRIREPRLRDYVASRGRPTEDMVIVFLSGMLLDEDGKEFGEERVNDLPLKSFGRLSDIVNGFLSEEKDPLDRKSDSASA